MHMGHSWHFLMVWVMLLFLFSTAATATLLPIASIEVNHVDDATDAAYAAKDAHHDSDNQIFSR